MRKRELENLVNGVIGTNIKSIRLGLGLSQTDVAKLLGVTYQQVQKYENGDNRISSSCLFLLAQHLDVPIEDFFNGITINI